MLPRRISFRTLLIASLLGDFLDFFNFGLPILDLPLTILHFMFAGPLAIATLTEYIPIVGMLPIYTVACFVYLAFDGKKNIARHAETVLSPPPTALQSPVPSQSMIIDVTPAPSAMPKGDTSSPVLFSSSRSTIEQRLAQLAKLLAAKHISQEEHDAKRQQILAEL